MTLTAITILASVLLGLWAFVRRSFSRERDARVKAEVERDQAAGERDVAVQKAAVIAADAAQKVTARADERRVEAAATEASAAGDPHPERAAARERVRAQKPAVRKIAAARTKGGRP